MAILPNGLNLSQAFVGNSEVQSAWLGNTKIWEKQGGGTPRPSNTKYLLHLNGNVNDEIGLYASPTLNGGSFTSGKFNQCIYFTRTTSQRIQLDRSVLNFGSSSFTFACWINCIQAGSEWYQTICADCEPTGGTGFIVRWLDSGNKISVSFPIGLEQGITLNSSSLPSMNAWHHIAFVKDSTAQTANLYIDGILTDSVSTSDPIYLPTGADYKFWVGNVHYSSETARGFKGYIDEVMIAHSAVWTTNFTPPTSQYD